MDAWGKCSFARDVSLSGMLTVDNRLFGAPQFTTRSNSTQIFLWEALTNSAVDYALGIEGSTLWNSVPDASHAFKWYVGTTNIMSLYGSGSLRLENSSDSSINLTSGTALPAPAS